MPTLADIQSGFVDGLKRPEAPVPDAIGRKDGQPAKRRFDVYRNNVAAGMIEALRATYPAIERLVGADFFAASARVYLDRNPPRSPLLFRYGESFGAFLDGFPPAASTPYLGDVARLEWARVQAYHAEDAVPLAIAALAGYPERDTGGLRFTLHPSLALIPSRWPVVSLWAASTGQGASEEVDMKAPEVRAGHQAGARCRDPETAREQLSLHVGAPGWRSARKGGRACRGCPSGFRPG